MFGKIVRVRLGLVFGLAAVGLLASGNTARADESNRNEVRANLEKGQWSVIWGKNFTEGDWVKGTAAIAESIAEENPSPFLKWFGQVVSDNFSKIEKNLPGVAQKDLQRWVLQSLKNKQIVTYKGFEIEAGFATYNRWEKVIYDEPRTREKWIQVGPLKTKGFETYTARVEKRVPLPNWHQFYIRYKLVPSTTGHSGGSTGDVGQTAGVQFKYTIKNDSGKTVTFGLPSGREYSLEPNETGSYHFSGNPASAKIHVHGTERNYLLAEGNHRFWWMTKENRVGLDIAGR